MAGKIIEIIVLIAGLLLTAVIVVAIPMKSYNEYKDYLVAIEKQNEENKQAQIKPVLESIDVELKEGVRYFANDMAEARAEHFIVTANYTKGEEAYSEPVEEDKFTVKTASDFYSVGGEVTITYRNKSVTVKVELEPVVLESISVATAPYVLKYAAGSTFDASGMVINAVYNDGSTKTLNADQYVVDTTTPLTVADKKVTVSYKVGEITKTVDIEIGVSETLDDGAVKSIAIVGDAIVNAGAYITSASMEVNAIYESGNRKALSADEYTISGTADAVQFGKTYEITVTYNEDPTKTAKADVVVRQTVQGEDGVIVGGSTKTETEYVVIDGVITETTNSVTFAGNFSKSVLNGEEASLTLSIVSAADTIGNITMRCSNSYNVYANGVDKMGGYMMQPLQINTILDLTVNGVEVQVPATVILKGCGPYESYAPLYGIYYEFTFEDVQLYAGNNDVKFNFKKSTIGATNCWGESPSTLNIDYVHFDTVGSEIPDNYTVSGIEITGMTTAEYGMNIADFKANAVGIIEGGKKVAISNDMYSVAISGGKEGATTFGFGTYTVTVSLVSNPDIKATKEFVIEEFESFEVLHAGVELDGDKVYYVFTGSCTVYKPEDIVFFDGTAKFDYTTEIANGEFVLKVDVTNLAAGTIYPHMKVGGVNYDNGGANANGDVRGRGLKYTEGQGVVFGGKSYTIKTAYSMPTLVIAEVSGYVAVINNSYTSDKALLGEYRYGSEGVTVTGGSKSKDSEYVNGIGGMDKKDATVTYTFNVSADGKVDFVWNIAGNYWNGSGNDGIKNAADHIKVTIDGKEVSFNGIELPAGTGTATQIWWNLQQIVINNVALTAGTHTFTCTILNDGSGLNIGAMNIYFASN